MTAPKIDLCINPDDENIQTGQVCSDGEKGADSLQKRCDKYVNDKDGCPIAKGLIRELRNHLRAAHKGTEIWADVTQHIFKTRNKS